MKNWQQILIPPETTIIETLKVIDQSAMQIALVVDHKNKLLGTVTDGDVRRGILNKVNLDETIDKIMNKTPFKASTSDTSLQITALMTTNSLKQVPIVDHQGTIVDLKTFQEYFIHNKKENPVVLMAGGLGTRLQPLTKDTPKPLLKVGDKPILETILETFIEYNFCNFYISVNYKSELIKNYFGDGSKWGVSINYIDETKKLGTAGALSLLKTNSTLPFIVMNGDLLTKVNFEQLLEFHQEHDSIATMCVREYHHQVPYGVIQCDNHVLTAIEEKPTQRFFVNAGIYVLNQSILSLIPHNEFYDMPILFQKVIDSNQNTSVFPIREYWLDIGRMSDFEKANIEFSEVFK
ncbi:alcohol dehydrogenase [Anaerobacillus alkalidiazotrophicus]|uniref:Alcohol dehydrogenase n=1 Tax=Anaerobacillus alkalidiazotrophicus TaxID=472963 RepID=A0A1S2MEU2_9BACI|nr:nucleotidyltransferase family protein [Anaerobacillus alkalidiazotrophicus]OIJ22377.1 alcohol dehydrogenase [Anaerobacillus alkalidiazotrophicus]